MRVLVTGGTGFVGAHSVAALQRAGHEVRLLARARERVGPALEPLGVGGLDVQEGDCRDPHAVARAVRGCDAVLHCANVFTWQPARQHDLVDVNVATTQVVLGTAAEAGLDPVVHVSSSMALVPSADPLSESSPIGTAERGYAASKAAAERVARELQEQRAPVVITYPAMVLGPHDPYVGASTRALLDLVKVRRPLTSGALGVVDVRDVAAIHAAVMVAGLGPRRFLACGHDVTITELARRAGAAAGLDVRPRELSARTARLGGIVFDALARIAGPRITAGSRTMEAIAGYAGSASTTVRDELGIPFRPLDETLRDVLAWLRAEGHLRRRGGAGQLGAPASA